MVAQEGVREVIRGDHVQLDLVAFPLQRQVLELPAVPKPAQLQDPAHHPPGGPQIGPSASRSPTEPRSRA